MFLNTAGGSVERRRLSGGTDVEEGRDAEEGEQRLPGGGQRLGGQHLSDPRAVGGPPPWQGCWSHRLPRTASEPLGCRGHVGVDEVSVLSHNNEQ